jgi:uncharacterized protein (DUF885 family)
MADPNLAALAEEYWDTLLELNPTTATVLGDHRFDDQIEDLSAEGEAAARRRWGALLERLHALPTAGLDGEDRVTHGQMATELAQAIAGIDQRLAELQSDQMTGYHVGVLQTLPVMSAPDAHAAGMLVERFRRLPAALDQAARRYVEGAAAGRTPAAICVRRAASMLEGYLSSPLDADVFATLAGADSARPLLSDLARDVIRPAYARMVATLTDRLLPVARDDEHCGLAWIDDGPAIYATLVAQHTTLDLSPDEIHAIGMEEVTEKLPAEYAEVGGRLFGISDPARILDRLRTDPALRYRAGDEVLADARDAFEDASAAMGDWFGRLPKAPCSIEVVPDFLAPDSPSAYYFPPPGDGSRSGIYYVNTDKPENKARYETASIAFHEAIPGHHLQLAIAVELDHLPSFRRFSLGNTAYVEGWGLYAERLADDMGLYDDDLELIGMLAADSIRACRLVVDTGMHALGWSRSKAIEFMAANTPVSVDEVTIEVDRYIGMPAQALAYKLGQREILRLRDASRAALGARFDVKQFHDVVLGSGAVALPVLVDLVDAWAGRNGAGPVPPGRR